MNGNAAGCATPAPFKSPSVHFAHATVATRGHPWFKSWFTITCLDAVPKPLGALHFGQRPFPKHPERVAVSVLGMLGQMFLACFFSSVLAPAFFTFARTTKRRQGLRKPVFFSSRTAPKDSPRDHQPPTANRCQPPPTANCQPPPTANHQRPPTTNRQPPTVKL